MSASRLIAKILLLILGLLLMALGISVSVRADLGVTPISCVPYIYSLNTPFTLGQLTIAMNACFVLMQIAILRRKYSPLQLVQLPAVFVLGAFIDLTLPLVSGLQPAGYAEQVFWLLASCVLIALGVFLVVKANITYIPGDGLMVVIARTYRRDFGKTKMCFDCSMVAIGVASSLALMGRVEGVREGTVVAALLVGFLIQVCGRALAALCARFGRCAAPVATAAPEGGYGAFPVITISREYGSGGHEIGRLMAEQLGFTFYDKELIVLTAEQGGLSGDYVAENEQRLASALIHELYAQNFAAVPDQLPPLDSLFLVQSRVIREVCSKGPCVIVGRCADYVLKDNPKSFNVFIHADAAFRRAKIVADYGAADAYSLDDLDKADRSRANYCLNYTGRQWRDAGNYHAALDSSLYSREKAAQMLIELFRSARLTASAAA